MADLLRHFSATRQRTEIICAPLATEDYVLQAALFASPPKWHLAHTTWFFEEMILKKYKTDYNEFNPIFGFLFNSYYNSIGRRTERSERGLITRPAIGEVYAYRRYVTEHLINLLKTLADESAIALVELGINHEQQHQELLLTDLKYGLSFNPTHPVYKKEGSLVNDFNDKDGFVTMKEGVYEIGYEGPDFHFDNEAGKHRVYLHQYAIANALVTNGEFIEFINDGGYSHFNYWLDEGWHWVEKNAIKHPLYWQKIDGKWFQFTLGGLSEVNESAILTHVSFYEANAFAAWKKMRLPTEFEWEAANKHFNWGQRWEWTNSAYLPYPHFKTGEGAVGEYNGKFMINQMVLRGGSVATAKGHSRATYRNFFHPFYQWQYTGIRLAK